MIVSIEGKLVSSTLVSAVIDVNGIGYEVHVPLTVSTKFPNIGSQLKLHTYAIYREDKQELYGFSTTDERDFFRLMVEKVSGVGPKTTLNLMSKLSLNLLKDAITMRNADIIAQCHGIGKKSAERIIMELSDKDFSTINHPQSINSNVSSLSTSMNDAIAALISLGYKANDAEKAIQRSISKLGNDASTENLIRSALNS